MTAPTAPSLLDDALDFLIGLTTDDADPVAARERLDGLRERHPDVRLRLVWQREAYDGSLQYDLLIARAAGDVISLAFCPDRTLPWSLRGGHRASERLLLRVNGVPMEIDQAIASLDFLWDEAPLTDRLVTACLIRQELEEAPVALGAQELQAAMDAFRRARGLLTVAATEAWMAHRGLSHRGLEELVAVEAAVAALRRRETASQVTTYFEENRQQLAAVRLASLVFPSQAAALDALSDIRDGADFFAVAERWFAMGAIGAPSAPGVLASSAGIFALKRRDELAESVASQVFEAGPGATLGPFATDGGYEVVKVIAIEDAVLNDATVALIEQRLFARWLASRRRSARVEWFWGSAARTSGAGDVHHDVRDDVRAGSPS